MSWARGTSAIDPRRRIGYAYSAKCHERGCGEKIDRGLSFWCGDRNFTDDGYGCGWFFCGKHLRVLLDRPKDWCGAAYVQLCAKCLKTERKRIRENQDMTPRAAWRGERT